MACLYTHNGKTYSKEELIEYLKNNPDRYKVKPDFSNIDEIIDQISDVNTLFQTNIKEGVPELFESNPELASIGTPELYSQYLDTIFPYSKVKDIVYHGSPSKHDVFKTVDENAREERFKHVGAMFTSDKNYVSAFGENLYNVVLNIKNPVSLPDNTGINSTFVATQYYSKWKDENIDSVIGHDALLDLDNISEGTEYVVFEPEQIHILGSQKDIKGFKDFIRNNVKSTEKKELSNRTITRLNKLLKEQADKLKARILVFESAKERKGYLPKEDTINKLKDLKEQLSTLENTEAFFKTAEFMHHELSTTQDFLDNKFDVNNPDHINFLLQISNQLESYKDLATFFPQLAGYNQEIDKVGNEINLMYADLNGHINEIIESYMLDWYTKNTKQVITKETILEMFKSAKDISIQELKMGGMSNSINPLLQLLQKSVEVKREEIYENTNNWKLRITNAGAKLKQAGVEGFDWMYQKTKDGKLTGRLLHKVSQAYYDTEKKIYKLLEDEHGNKREYIYKPGETLSAEEKKHNLKLAEDKKQLSSFLNAETVGDQGLQDGENRKYTDEFKQARAQYQFYGKAEDGQTKWIKKPFVPGSKLATGEELTSEMYDKLYKQFERKYYQDERESFSLVKEKIGDRWIPTGEVKRVLVTFVKPEYTEVVTERNGIPTKFGNTEYYKVMNDKTPQGLAKKEYFEFVKKANEELLDKLPLATAQKMQGKMFRVKSSLINDAKKLGIVGALLKGFRQFVNPDVIFSSRQLDENGQIVEDVPIMYTTELRNTEKLKKLEIKLKSLQAELLKNPSNKELANKIKIAKNVINIEENKLTPEELELDMTKSLIKVAHMAENYDLMKQAESTLMIARKIMKNTEFFKLNAAGQKEVIQGVSKTEERMDTYMRMIFYSNSTANQTKIAKLLQNFNTFVAYKSLGGNPFSVINNTIMANINNRIEGFGKQFGFDNKHLNQAIKDTTQQIASMNFMKHVGKDPHTIKPTNKFEAMLEKFNWIDRNQIIEDHSVLSTIMFGGITAGEFVAQSNSAIAKLRSEILTNSKTGEKLSVWEAHEFVNGELKLKDGFEYSAVKRRVISVEIKNMNKIIHGNYSEGDKVALQEFALGQTAMQFKKWLYNFGKSRYGSTYFDETTGDYQEGRYRTFANFISVIKAGGMYDFNSIKSAFNSLADYEKSNLKKLQVEGIYWMTTAVLMMLLEGIAKGIDDDDEELKMMVNFLRKQSDRVGGELDAAINPKSIYSSLKNPVAGLKSANDFAQLMSQLVKTPVNLALGNTKDVYITKGPNKGMTKLGKEFRDVVPVANLESQFDNLLNSGNFYFR